MKNIVNDHIRAFQCLIFMGGLFILLVAASVMVNPASGEVYDINAVRMKSSAVAEEKEDTIDVLFLGNSESYRAFSPLQLYSERGITSYNLGASALRACDCREILGETLKKQSPKVVMLETDTLFEEGSPYRDPEANLTNKVESKLPLFHYHTFYKSYLPKSVKAKDMYYKDAGVFKGFLVETMVRPYEGGDYMSLDAPKAKIREQNGKTLKDIIRICEENDASLVLVSSPSATNWNKSKHAAVEKWLDKNSQSIEYIDLNQKNDELGIDWSKDTMDNGNHMNLEGSKKVMRYVGSYLSENFDLTDHRGDERYSSWDENEKKAELYL